jgi:MFS family permease
MANHQKRLFIGCIIALVATAFGFIVRSFLLDEWEQLFNLTQEEKGRISGAGLFPFAVSIIFFSLIIDKIGYGPTMAFAWLGHVASAVITIRATSYEGLYFGTLLYALANGAVEAVINPVTASLYPKEKTHYLNILHAGWPGGLVVGGVLAILVNVLGVVEWRWQVGLVLIPTVLYGILLAGQKFPVGERVAAGVSYRDMLREFGVGGCLIAMGFLAYATNDFLVTMGVEALRDEQTATIFKWAFALVPTIAFGLYVRALGRPMFIILLLVMVLLATTELGTDSWIANIMTGVLGPKFGENAGNWVLVYTSAIMFVLRFFAGPIVHRTSPLGLLAICAAVASLGLYALSSAGDSAMMIFLAATLYGFGKTFFWPTTLGVVAEQFPKGGALTLNAIAGVGMISVGVIGGPFLGALQDKALDKSVSGHSAALYEKVARPDVEKKYFLEYRALDQARIEALPSEEKTQVQAISASTRQATLATFAIFPAIMFACYVLLILYFKARGGYRPVELVQAPPSGAGDERY